MALIVMAPTFPIKTWKKYVLTVQCQSALRYWGGTTFRGRGGKSILPIRTNVFREENITRSNALADIIVSIRRLSPASGRTRPAKSQSAGDKSIFRYFGGLVRDRAYPTKPASLCCGCSRRPWRGKRRRANRGFLKLRRRSPRESDQPRGVLIKSALGLSLRKRARPFERWRCAS